jgi:hypothetical protein
LVPFVIECEMIRALCSLEEGLTLHFYSCSHSSGLIRGKICSPYLVKIHADLGKFLFINSREFGNAGNLANFLPPLPLPPMSTQFHPRSPNVTQG